MTYAMSESYTNALVVALQDTFDAQTAPRWQPIFDRLLTQPQTPVTVDLSSVELMDSVGLGTLMRFYQRSRAQGQRVSFANVRDQPLELFRLLKIDRLISRAG